MTALFTSVDELWASFPQQHGYHYAYHDPVNFSDPSGMASVGGNQVGGNDDVVAGRPTRSDGGNPPPLDPTDIPDEDPAIADKRA
jgi:hypothetical protein